MSPVVYGCILLYELNNNNCSVVYDIITYALRLLALQNVWSVK